VRVCLSRVHIKKFDTLFDSQYSNQSSAHDANALRQKLMVHLPRKVSKKREKIADFCGPLKKLFGIRFQHLRTMVRGMSQEFLYPLAKFQKKIVDGKKVLPSEGDGG
jgi:hypothetical protein